MKNALSIFQFAWPYIRPYWGRLCIGLLLGILFGISNAAILGSTKGLLNRVFPEEASRETRGVGAGSEAGLRERLTARIAPIRERIERAVDPWLPTAGRRLDLKQVVGMVLIVPVLFGIRGYIGFLSSYCMRWTSERAITDLRQDIFRKLTTLSVEYYNRARMGDMISHIMTDTAAIQRTLSSGVADCVKEPATILFTIGFMLWLDWRLTIFVAVFLPLCVVPMLVLGRKIRRATREHRRQSAAQGSLLIEALGSIRVIKAYGLEKDQLDRFGEFSRQLLRQTMKNVRARELINPAIETVGAIGVAILLVYILATEKSGADLAVFLGAVMTIYTPIKNLGKLHAVFQESGVAVERIGSLMDEKATVVEPANPAPMKPFSREIRFENVTFGYGNEPVLRSLNLSIPRGKKLGIAGESGVGKSTLVNLLLRFYDPTGGRITIDGTDIRELSSADLRAQIALVSQEIVLFDTTAAENIACGRNGATQEEVEAAARAAFAHDFISALPEGYSTRVGERGVMLSGGQRQRIAIARAFIRNAPILALDEATASLDAQSELEVQFAIERLAEERTVICVAHRLSTLAKMDEIIFLTRKGIHERGTFEELLRAGGPFASLARQQGIIAPSAAVALNRSARV